MKKIILMSSSLLMLAGCVTPPIPVAKVEMEPILVGIPLNERIAKTSNVVNEQLDLLNKLRQQKYIGKYEMVEHNNGLDARKGSDKTIPQAYAVETVVPPKVAQVEIVNPDDKKFQKLKKLDWKNNSANDLGKLFAKSLGYEFVVSGNKDVNISLLIENETIESSIVKFSKVLAKDAVVIVVEKNKTLNIIYK